MFQILLNYLEILIKIKYVSLRRKQKECYKRAFLTEIAIFSGNCEIPQRMKRNPMTTIGTLAKAKMKMRIFGTQS